jgi:hypothetical protein
LLASQPNATAAEPMPEAKPKASEDWGWIEKHTYDKHEWPVEVIRRATVESNNGQRQFLRYLAERAGKPLTTQQIADGLGVERKNIAGALSGLSRRAKSRYKLPIWFFWAQWDGNQYTYRMDQREAAIVLELLDS